MTYKNWDCDYKDGGSEEYAWDDAAEALIVILAFCYAALIMGAVVCMIVEESGFLKLFK